MAAGRKLKVYRTPIGFHDAFVAAPSRKAALEAWGSEHDLFARGIAEEIADPALMEAPLASPGTVIKRLRGTAAEQIAALPPEKAPPPAPAGKAQPENKPRRKPKPLPPPDRASLDAAARALEDADVRQQAEDKALREEEAALARKRREQDKAHAAETERLQNARETAAAAYERAMKKWRG